MIFFIVTPQWQGQVSDHVIKCMLMIKSFLQVSQQTVCIKYIKSKKKAVFCVESKITTTCTKSALIVSSRGGAKVNTNSEFPEDALKPSITFF